MPTFLTPIVGTHFHPPAKLLLTKLPVGTPLILSPTPDNPYDSNAIEILLASSNKIAWTESEKVRPPRLRHQPRRPRGTRSSLDARLHPSLNQHKSSF